MVFAQRGEGLRRDVFVQDTMSVSFPVMNGRLLADPGLPLFRHEHIADDVLLLPSGLPPHPPCGIPLAWCAPCKHEPGIIKLDSTGHPLLVGDNRLLCRWRSRGPIHNMAQHGNFARASLFGHTHDPFIRPCVFILLRLGSSSSRFLFARMAPSAFHKCVLTVAGPIPRHRVYY